MKINYGKLVDQALMIMVKDIFKDIQRGGGSHLNEIYITFNTQAKGIIMSEKLLKMYPSEMSLLFFGQTYQALEVSDTHITVSTTMGAGLDTITIPFTSIKQYIDKTNQYALNFKHLSSIEVPQPTFSKEDNVVRINFKTDE